MRSPLPALLLLVVAVGAAVVWLLAEEAGSPGAQRAAPPSTPGVSTGGGQDGEPSRISLPQPRADDVVPLEPPPSPAVASEGDAGSTSAPRSSGPRTFTGRLLTPDGSPRANAEVAWLPEPETLLTAGLVKPPRDPSARSSRRLANLGAVMVSTRTDIAGRFTLDVDEPGLVDTKQRTVAGPLLVVRCPDAMAFLAPIADDLGEVIVCSEGPFAVDVVDESGQPVVDAWAEVVVHWSRRPGCAGTAPEQRDPQHTFACRGVLVPLNATASARFERDDLPTIYGSLVAGAPGYATVSRRLSADARTKPQEPLVLPPAGRFTGRVLAPDGAPLPGALVTITHEPGTYYPVHHGAGFMPSDDTLMLALTGSTDSATRRVLSNEDGRFTFDDLPARTHDVFVQAAVYQPLRERYVSPGVTPIELRLEPLHRLDVLVRDEQGHPVEGARVEAWRGGMFDVNVLRVHSPEDPSQPHVIWGASERVTTVRAVAPWRVAVREQARDGPTSMQLVLPPAGALEVIVREAGDPLAGIEIRVGQATQGPVLFSNRGQLMTEADGVARFDNLEPGLIQVGAATGFGGRSVEFGEPVIAEVRAGELSTVHFDARPEALVHGEVAGAGSGVLVSFERDGRSVGRSRTRDTGQFGFEIAAGAYQVLVDGELVASLVLLPGEEKHIELPAARGARIEGRLTSGGRPLAGWTVGAFGPGSAPQKITDEQGRFALELPAGGRWRPRFSYMSRQGPLLEALDIDPGGIALLDVELPSTSVSVRTIDSNGTPVTKIVVTFRRVDNSASVLDRIGIEVTPDKLGVATADWLSPGTWLAEVSDGWTWQPRAGESFDLAEGKILSRPDLVLQRACTVRGRAWATPGALVGNEVKVLFVNSEGDREETYVSNKGHFNISWLPSGRWQVVLIEEGLREQPIDVPPGAGRSLDLSPGEVLKIDLVMPPLR